MKEGGVRKFSCHPPRTFLNAIALTVYNSKSLIILSRDYPSIYNLGIPRNFFELSPIVCKNLLSLVGHFKLFIRHLIELNYSFFARNFQNSPDMARESSEFRILWSTVTFSMIRLLENMFYLNPSHDASHLTFYMST